MNAKAILYYVYNNGTSPIQKEWPLLPHKLFCVEDLDSFLSQCNSTTISDIQYQKCRLELELNLDLAQQYSQPNGAASSYKYMYAKIETTNQSGVGGVSTYYYFIKKVEWRSQNTCKLYLVMDVLNTFPPFLTNSKYSFSNKTKILREMKDRFSVHTHYYNIKGECYGDASNMYDDDDVLVWDDASPDIKYEAKLKSDGQHIEVDGDFDIYFNNPIEAEELLSNATRIHIALVNDIDEEIEFVIDTYSGIYSSGVSLYRNIDIVSEGLSPVLYKKEEHEINRESILNCDWYLLYRNQNDPSDSLVNPVECYLIPSTEVACNLGSIQSGGRINPDNLETGKFYYIPLGYHQTINITLSTGVTLSYDNPDNVVIYVKKVDDTHIVVNTTTIRSEGGLDYIRIVDTLICEYFNISSLPCKYKAVNTLDTSYLYTEFTTDTFSQTWTSEGVSPMTLDSIDKLDRTDAKNIKLIMLPYIPYDFKVVSNKLVLTDTDFEHVSLTQSGGGIIEVLKLKNLNVKFNYDFIANNNPLDDLVISEDVTIDVATLRAATRDDIYESKIFHSDYLQHKFVYDSFSYVFALERQNVPYYKTHQSFKIKYAVTSTINSKFMFQFVNFKSDIAAQDYDNVVTIARNNEIVLYNVPYINYIRTGYNYDVKNKNASAVSSWLSVGLGATSTAAALLLPSAPLKIAGVIASVVSTINSVKSAVVTQLQNERNLDEKILASKNQATSVSGADDVDLMQIYAHNRAKMCKYECSDIFKQLMFDLFHYGGYISQRMGKPHARTRLWWDYLEADVVFNGANGMDEEIINELINCYKTGVTFLHNVKNTFNSGANEWDFNQEHENWELSFINKYL